MALAACSISSPNAPALSEPFAHHVLFWLKDGEKNASYSAILKALKEFRNLPEVKFLHIGSPSISDIDYEAQATDATYTISYLAFFESRKAKEDYLSNPLHKKFLNDFKEIVSKVIIYDSLNIL